MYVNEVLSIFIWNGKDFLDIEYLIRFDREETQVHYLVVAARDNMGLGKLNKVVNVTYG